MSDYVCPHCQKRFPGFYWGVTGRAAGFGTVKKPGLAKANFDRHKKACSEMTKAEELAISLLLKCARRWPDGISLFSAAGSLVVVRDDDGEILAAINIPNDGGDPVTQIRNGKEYLLI